MKDSHEHYYAVFQLSIPNTLGRKNRKKIIFEKAPANSKRDPDADLPADFSAWIDDQTSLLKSQYKGESVELLEADIAVSMHEVRSIIFQEGIAQGDIVRRVRETNEEE